MKKIRYKADSRGYANHGWLKSHHTFSFANYYNPERTHFGLLRVVNDDTVAPGMGFGTHPHDNMEIISIPLQGALAHKDSMSHEQTISPGEVQVMTAGTGITHSEYNANSNEEVKFFQIWVFPREKGLKPSYDQKMFDFNTPKNNLTLIVSPDGSNGSLKVQQDVWFSIGKFNEKTEFNYTPKKSSNGLFIMVIEGDFEIDGEELNRRDAVGLYEVTDQVKIKSLSSDAQLLIIDVPMQIG